MLYQRLHTSIRVLIVLGAAILIVQSLVQMATLLVYPYAHDGLEGTLLYEARILRSGQALYQPLERFRFLSAPYPPLSYAAFALFDLISGPHVFWGGRLVSFLAACGVAVGVAGIVRQHSTTWPVALFAAGLILSAPPIQLWATRIKPDLLALLLTTTGLYLTSRLLIAEQGSGWRVALAALVFALAFFTKQTALAGPLAAGLALLAAELLAMPWFKGEYKGGLSTRFVASERRKSQLSTSSRLPADEEPGALGEPARRSRRERLHIPMPWWRAALGSQTLRFAFSYLALVVATWTMLDLISQGNYTLHVWWSGQRTQWWSFALFRKFVDLILFWWPQMILAAFALALVWRERRLLLPASYLLVAPLTLLGAGETGANHNHLLELHLALTIAGCSMLGTLQAMTLRTRASDSLRPTQLLALLALLLCGMQFGQTFSPPAWYRGELAPSDAPERYLAFIRATPGEVLADDTGLLFQAGRDLRYDDPSTMGPAAAIGAWDQSGLLEEIAARRFSAIMLPVDLEASAVDPTGRWTPAMLAAIHKHYRLVFRDTIYTYQPR